MKVLELYNAQHSIKSINLYRVDIGELVMPLVHILSRLLHDILM